MPKKGDRSVPIDVLDSALQRFQNDNLSLHALSRQFKISRDVLTGFLSEKLGEDEYKRIISVSKKKRTRFQEDIDPEYESRRAAAIEEYRIGRLSLRQLAKKYRIKASNLAYIVNKEMGSDERATIAKQVHTISLNPDQAYGLDFIKKRNEAVERYLEGQSSISEIAKIFNINEKNLRGYIYRKVPKEVRNVLQIAADRRSRMKRGGSTDQKLKFVEDITPEIEREFNRRRKQGISYNDIATEMGFAYSTIVNYFQKKQK
ncbi:MAG: hypothetical protein WCJ19_03510 [bacterium]